MPRIWQLDVLRTIATIAVVLGHCLVVDSRLGTTILASLWWGLDLFFVMSGFLITGLLARDAHRPGRLRWFFAGRTLRIFPLYFLWLGILFGVNRLVPRESVTELEACVPYLVTYTANFWIVAHDAWLPSDHLNHTWSLAVEEQFYLLWPLVFYALPRRGFVPLALAIVLLCQLVKLGMLGTDVSAPALYTNTATRMDALLCGALAWYALEHHRGSRWLRCSAGAIFAVALAALAVLAVDEQHLALSVRNIALGTSLYAWLFGALLVLLLAAERPRAEPRWLSRPCRVVATLSYGIYLSHWVIWRAVEDWALLPADTDPFTRCAVVLGASAGVAWVLYRLVELPFLRLRSLLRGARPEPAAV